MSGEKSPSTEPLLEAVDASVAPKRFLRVQITGIDWRVVPGEFWVIGGAHGSGKSVLLATAAGLLPPASGVIRHFGRDLSTLPEAELLRERTRLGFVFQGNGRIFGDLTIAENVALPLRYHRDWTDGEASQEVRAVLEATGLNAMAGETGGVLALNWQQRVGLARALVLRPEILFVDQPLSGLEPRHRPWWRDFLAQLAQGHPLAGGRKMAIVAATNDFSLWSGGGHRFGLIREGRWLCVAEGAEPPELN
jgi:ABC-type transporter Mla maintaining outer membrane lipid asymmetry ATPase subunit MlaF